MRYSKAGRRKRRALSGLLALCMMLGLLPPLTMTAQAAGSAAAARIYALRDRYPQGCYWNHAGPDLNGYGVTEVPCPSHDSYATCNSYIYNGDTSYQCKGFAKTIFKEVFGQEPDDLPKNYDIENVMPGDYVRFGGEYASHSFIVLERNGDEVTVLECNIGGRCIIQWGRVQSLSGALNYASASNPQYVYFNYSVHASNYDELEMPAGFAMPEDPSYRPIPDGDYYIVSALEGDRLAPGSYCLGIDGAPGTYDTGGANAVLWPGYGSKEFLFTVTWMENGFYRIGPRYARNHSLGVSDAGTQAGANVRLCEGQGGQAAQQWWIAEQEGGPGCTIRAGCSGFYLDVENAGAAAGANIDSWVDDGSFAQYWYLILLTKRTGQAVPGVTYPAPTRAGRVIGGDAPAMKQQPTPLQGKMLHRRGDGPHISSAGKDPGPSQGYGASLWIIAGLLAAAGCGCLVLVYRKRKKTSLAAALPKTE